MNRTRRDFVKRCVETAPGAVGAAVTLILVCVAIAAPMIWSTTASTLHMEIANRGPSGSHWLGTDDLGRDVLLRTLVATRLSLWMAAVAAGLAATIGVPLGVGFALLGRRGRRFAGRLVDASLAFPPMLLAIVVVVIVSPGVTGALIATGISHCPLFIRLTNSLALSVASRDFILSSKALGVRRFRMLRSHILPNIAEPIVIACASTVGASLVSISALSFLGIGVQQPRYDWGALLNEGFKQFYVAPAAALAPATAVALAGLAIGMLGDGFAHALNPRVWTARRKADGSRGDVSMTKERTPSLWNVVPLPHSNGDVSPVASGHEVVKVRNLIVRFPGHDREVFPVRGVDLTVHEGEIVGLVGESGSGKSLTALAVAQLVGPPGVVQADELEVGGVDLLAASKRNVDTVLGTKVGFVFQDPLSSLNPALRVASQLTEASRRHRRLGRRKALATAAARLEEVHLGPAKSMLRRYPHQLSGGQRQRAMIAAALMNEPALIIADEPTTALDVTVQAQIIALLREVRSSHNAGVLLISHNIGVIVQLCDRVNVMYAGRIVEELATSDLIEGRARHPYTRALLMAVPSIEGRERLTTIPGRPPAPDEILEGCAFAPRCPFALPACAAIVPELVQSEGSSVACWNPQSDVLASEGARQ